MEFVLQTILASASGFKGRFGVRDFGFRFFGFRVSIKTARKPYLIGSLGVSSLQL